MLLPTRSIAALALMCLGGCAFVDSVEPRIGTYNAETANSKSASVLTNIMRASYSQPLQFTDVTSFSGQNSAGFQSGSSVPVATVPAALAKTFTISPQLNVSGNTTFSVANLNTQEFYYGLQTPISLQLIAAYIRAGYDPYILLPLVISEIEITTNGYTSTLSGSAADPENFAAFYVALKFLIDKGLTAEQVKGTAPVGPLLTSNDVRNPKVLAALVANASPDTPQLENVKGGFQLKKSKASFRFCFDRLKTLGSRPFPKINFVYAKKRTKAEPIHIALGKSYGKDIPSISFIIEQKYFCSEPNAPRSGEEKSVGATLRFTTRSLQGIFYFLGESVRTELGIGNQQPRSLAIPFPGDASYYLFHVQNGASGSSPSIFYNGQTYSYAIDPTGKSDGSSRIIQFLVDLLALQSSAKSFPTPNVISVISP